MPTTPENATDATPLGEGLADYEAQGFTAQLAAQEDGRVICYACHESSPAADIRLTALLRTEGASDPDDMTAVAAVTCPRCGAKGTLVLHYGALAPPEHDDVLRALEDRRDRDGVKGGITSRR
jgi:hypothetical protein